MMTNLDPVSESVHRSQQFRGPLQHEQEVRRIAGDILAAHQAGQLSTHDVRTIADCLETAMRKKTQLKSV